MAYKKGESGNITGRKPGIKDKRAEIRDLFAEAGPRIVKKVLKGANDGDTDLMCYAIDHFTPKARERIYISNLNSEDKKLKDMTYEEKMRRLDHLMAEEEIDRESWNIMRASYIKEHEVDVVKIENTRLLEYSKVIQKLLKEKGIDLVL